MPQRHRIIFSLTNLIKQNSLVSAKIQGRKTPLNDANLKGNNYFAHFWFATVQEVLQADWHEAWHSPQPPFCAVALRFLVFIVLMCFICNDPPYDMIF